MSALVPYKRLDVAIDACQRARVPLTIVGSGPERARLERAAGPEVEFLGWRNDEEIRALYQQSRAVLLPGVEDFGLVPVEAQACGCPVIAFAEGGATETVIDGETGVLVKDRSAEAFADGIARVSALSLDRDRLRRHALQFSKDQFLAGFQAVVAETFTTAARRTRSQQPADVTAARRTRLPQPADPENER